MTKEELVKRMWIALDEERCILTDLLEKPNLTKRGRLTLTGRIAETKHQYVINKIKEILEIV